MGKLQNLTPFQALIEEYALLIALRKQRYQLLCSHSNKTGGEAVCMKMQCSCLSAMICNAHATPDSANAAFSYTGKSVVGMGSRNTTVI